MTTSRELQYFPLLTRDQQIQAIRRLRAMGMSDQTISTATRLSVEHIKAAVASPNSETSAAVETSAPPLKAGEAPSGVRRLNCSRTGVPAEVCTCIGPHEGAA